jgi:hypothetical protein
VYVLPPGDRDLDGDEVCRAAVDGAELVGELDRELDEELEVVDAEVSGGADVAGVDGAPAPIPCPGEDVLHAANSSTAAAIAKPDRRCTATLPSRRRRRSYPTNVA